MNTLTPRRRTRLSRTFKLMRQDALLYAMLVPGLIFFLLFRYLPMYGITIAFRSYNIFKGLSASPWVGMDIFRKLFSLPAYWRAFQNTLILSLMFISGFPLTIILSLMINEVRGPRLKKFIQTSVILPNFISWVVVGSLIYTFFSQSSGLVKSLLAPFGITMPNLLTNQQNFRWLLFFSHVWKNIGMGTIVYLAAITNVDPQLYDAAKIDGAGHMRQIWHITLSCIRPTILTLFIFRVGSLLNLGFEQMYVMSNPLVLAVSEVIDTYVYKIGLVQQNFSLATAAGVLKSAIGLVLVIFTNVLAKKIDPDSGIM